MTRNEFERQVVDVAVPLYNTYKILPSVILAQAVLESGWGKSSLATIGKALFGIKATASWKGKVYNAKTKECYDGKNFVDEVATFRAYDTWKESIIDHCHFLCSLKRYARVVGEKNYSIACKELQKAGYATDPNYADKLINIIRENGFDSYDIVSKVDEEVPESPCKVVYIVESGDTLEKIAKSHNLTVSRLCSLNKDISNPNKIYIGQEIKLN